MFVAGDPGDGAVGERTDDGSKPQRHVPDSARRELGAKTATMARPADWDEPMARPARLAATQNCQRSVEKAATAIIAIQTQSVPASASLWPMRSCT